MSYPIVTVLKAMTREALLTVPCHRMPSRCFHIKGKPMPICSRCQSILLGYLFVPLFLVYPLPIVAGVLMQIPMLVDGFTQKWGWRKSNNLLRTITGLTSGIGLSVGVAGAVYLLV